MGADVGNSRSHKRRNRRYVLAFCILAALLAALALANLCIGSLPVPPADIASILAGNSADLTSSQVIWEIRLPRLIAAMLLGGALALSGFLLQTFFNNPIAGPYILGISSGAKLAVAFVMIIVLGSARSMPSWLLIGAAFVGSLAVMLMVLAVSQRIRSAAMLIVAGVMVGYLCSAATDFLITFASDANIASLKNWSMGSFSGVGWTDVRIMTAVVLVASACVFLLAKPIGAYQLGESYARSLGVNVRAFRVALIALSSLLAACVTAFAGPISFVGIAVPHLVKRLMGTSKPIVVIPAAFLGGAVFCLMCDLIARTMFAPTEVSISAVTAVFGAPVVIGILLRRHQPHVRETQETGSADSAMPSAETTKSLFSAVEQSAGLLGAEPQACLTVRGLEAGYAGKPVVQDVDVRVMPGDVVTLIGPNGGGKSTVLKAVSGQIEAMNGTVEVSGRALDSLTDRERALQLAVLLTDRVQTELLTCEDVVAMGRYPHTGRMGGLRRHDWEVVRAAMQEIQVWDLRNRDFMQLSDGQRQRVLIARALCQQPRLLVLDEPTNYLDIHYHIELLGVLRRISEQGRMGVLMSLHELPLARVASTRVVCVKNGRVVAEGAPDQVFTEQVIDGLYDLKPGSYDPQTGNILSDGNADEVSEMGRRGK